MSLIIIDENDIWYLGFLGSSPKHAVASESNCLERIRQDLKNKGK